MAQTLSLQVTKAQITLDQDVLQSAQTECLRHFFDYHLWPVSIIISSYEERSVWGERQR